MMAKTALMWVTAMGWHLWRIGTLRPAFSKMSDTGATLVSFAAVMIFASWLRYVLFLGEDVLVWFSGLSVYAVGLLIVFERIDRSSSMTAAAFGFSAAIDLVMSTAVVSGIPVDSRAFFPNVLIEFVGLVILYFKFRREPVSVQACGYNRKSAA